MNFPLVLDYPIPLRVGKSSRLNFKEREEALMNKEAFFF